MVLIAPIIVYLVIVVSLLFLSNKILKYKSAKKRSRNRRWITVTASILFPILGFLYFLFLFGIALDDHHDVKRGTFLWYATMDNNTITEFPVVEPIGIAYYNKIGGDGPNIATGWEIFYESKSDIEALTEKINEYLKNDGYKIDAVEETKFYWIGKYKKNKKNRLYSGANKKGESLDLFLQSNDKGVTRVECSIVY